MTSWLIFQQDNNPKHKAKHMVEDLENNNVLLVVYTSETIPNLPIKHLMLDLLLSHAPQVVCQSLSSFAKNNGGKLLCSSRCSKLLLLPRVPTKY